MSGGDHEMSTRNDDWRLTAHALGETASLSDADRAAVESLLASDASARALVDEIRTAATAIASDLSSEAPPRLAPEQRAAILMAAARGTSPTATRSLWRSWIPFSAAAAALLALGGIVLGHRDESRRIEVMNKVAFVADYEIEIAQASNIAETERRLDRVSSLVGWRTDAVPSHTWTSPDPVMSRVRATIGTPKREETVALLDRLNLLAGDRVNSEQNPLFGAEGEEPLREAWIQYEIPNAEAYDHLVQNDFLRVVDHALSTFSIDVDTASYAIVRRMLNGGALPPPGAVRIEEFINYFPYRYDPPTGGHPFSVHLEVAQCPWQLEHRLVRIGLKGREVPKADRPAGNLVFLLDVSGSMDQPNKLPLVKASMKMLLDELTGRDKVSIVVYAGASGLVLSPTSCERKADIVAAIDALAPGGSTNGASGINLAYEVAKEGFLAGGTNRVILCTDGDFNVGVTSQDELVRLIEAKAKEKIFLSVLGYGMGNLKDSTLEKLADKGNGNYGYIDDEKEARKALVEQAGGTLVTIAKDVKIQVEFNPAQVSAYRLIGYENRMLAAQDFNDDTKDAGEIGAGHTVTALYEIVPAGKTTVVPPAVDPLKYQTGSQLTGDAASGETLTVKLRYKQPEGDVSTLMETSLKDFGVAYDKASPDFKFAASVAQFGLLLRDSAYKGTSNFDGVIELANESVGDDAGGYRREFVSLVAKAKSLKSAPPPPK